MSHLGLEAMRRILSGEGETRDAESAAEHIVSCTETPLSGEVFLQIGLRVAEGNPVLLQ
jgi:hypothetical protein